MQDWGERFSGAFVFTDIEGSSLLWEAHGNRFAQALEAHNAIISQVCEAHGGRVVNEEGDALFLAFPDADSSLAFALHAQDELQDYDWQQHGPDELRVRMGLHFGSAWRREEDLWGPEVNRAARICEAGHGGQVLASADFMDACGEPESEVVITDLGRHRLRGLAEPEHLYQLTRQDWEQQEWPALRSLDEVPTNLPAQVTSFVGRERELEQILALLTDDETRLVTLTGPGGSGKSRLAQQAAGQVIERFPDGVFWVELSDMTVPEAVAGAIMQVFKLDAQPECQPLDLIADYAHNRQILLILDNFEHLIEAADTVAELLRRTTTLKVVVTSREILRVPGEHVYEVAPLVLPEPPINWQTLSQYESVHLFLHRMREATGDFDITPENAAAVAEICIRLDGIPLALELAAAWGRVFTPTQMLKELGPTSRMLSARIRGAAERQRTLTDTIEWSYRLLEEEDQRAFRLLSVFRGGFFLDAAEAVCGPSAVDGVAKLCDSSLLYSREVLDQRRFYILETVRQFADARAVEGNEQEEARAAHLEHFADLGEQVQRRDDPEAIAELMLSGRDWAHVKLEVPNLLQAVRHAIECEALHRMEALLPVLSDNRAVDPGTAREMHALLEHLWQVAQSHLGETWTGVVARCVCNGLVHGGDPAAALRRAPQLFEFVKATGINEWRARFAHGAAQAALYTRNRQLAERWLLEKERWATTTVNRAQTAHYWPLLGMHQRATDQARELSASLSPDASLTERYNVAHALARAYYHAGLVADAYEPTKEKLLLIRGPRGTPPDGAQATRSFAVPIFALTGHVEEARELAREAASICAQLGPERGAGRLASLILNCCRGRLWDVAAELAEEFVGSSRPERWTPVELAHPAIGLAEAYARTGRAEEATVAIETLLTADWDWDNDMSYYTGQGLKATGEVLRVADKHPEAATVTELARRLHDDQPFHQGRAEELLELIAEEMSPEEFAAALKAADDLAPSGAIELAREALGL